METTEHEVRGTGICDVLNYRVAGLGLLAPLKMISERCRWLEIPFLNCERTINKRDGKTSVRTLRLVRSTEYMEHLTG